MANAAEARSPVGAMHQKWLAPAVDRARGGGGLDVELRLGQLLLRRARCRRRRYKVRERHVSEAGAFDNELVGFGGIERIGLVDDLAGIAHADD